MGKKKTNLGKNPLNPILILPSFDTLKRESIIGNKFVCNSKVVG